MRYSIFLLFLILLSCDTGVENDCSRTGGGIIDAKIPDTVNVSQSLEIEIVYGKPNPCYKLNELNVNISKDTVSVNALICYHRPGGTTCPQSPTKDSLMKYLKFQNKGIYKLIINDTVYVKDIVVE